MRVLSGGVTLEPQVEGHAAELYALLRDPLHYRYIDDDRKESVGVLACRLKRLETRRSPGGTEHWLNLIIRNADGYVQATVLAPEDGRTTAVIAYVLGSLHWRQGYAYAAMRLMLADLAETYGVTQRTATLDRDNVASVALLRKLGPDFSGPAEGPNEVRYDRSFSGEI